MPKIKEGPALLQKPNIRLAVWVVILLSSQAVTTDCAPTGYPPKKPRASIASHPLGMPSLLQITRNGGNLIPETTLQRIPERKKNGNSDGTTVLMHCCKPIDAPSAANCGERINRNNAIADPSATISLPILSPQLILCHSGQVKHP